MDSTAALEKEIRLIAERIAAINADAPEMTGMDWASDHGWISSEEWEAAEEKSKAAIKLQEEELAKLERLRESHPREMEEFLEMHISRLKAARSELARLAEEQKSGFAMSFNLTLLGDIIVCFGQWRARETVKHWPAWMWRVAFSVVEESESYIERSSKKS